MASSNKSSKSEIRKIIHIDMDAFFASVEQRNNIELKGKPVAVGGSGYRGVVAAASYEARKYGVKSAMPSSTAAKLCPGLIFVKPNFSEYKKVSTQIRSIFNEYTDLVEPLSLDEAYLDVTTNKKQNPSATLIADEIRSNIRTQCELTASAGISYNKFLAKVASDVNKPNGSFTILPNHATEFIKSLPIQRFYGIGKVTAERLNKMSIYNGADLLTLSKQRLISSFGKAGNFYYNIIRGIDNRAVNPDRELKSQGVENTFSKDLEEYEEIIEELKNLSFNLEKRLKSKNAIGYTITVKLKYVDFEQITRSQTSKTPIIEYNMILTLSDLLIRQVMPLKKPIRLLGIQISNLLTKEQLGKYGFQLVLPIQD